MSDVRRVCDLNAAELLEAALVAAADFGWASGRWVFEIHANDGFVRRMVPTRIEDVPIRVVVGRRQLEHVQAGELLGRQNPAA
jgi:hypothetical protein